jgi:hypothetical protein
MKQSIPHSLEIDQAKLVAKKAVEAYQERFAKYNFAPRWVDDTRVEFGFAVKGKRLEGAMHVRERSLDFELEVPFLFRAFSGKATSIIEEEVRKWIGRAERDEL